MPEQRPATPDEIIDGYAEMFHVPSVLARAVAKRESGLNPDVQPGDSGQAVGMFQLHEGAATDTGVTDRTNHAQNIYGGIKYLSQLSDRYKGDVSKMLMAYNGGMEGVDAGTPTPQAKAYADAIISEMTRGAASGTPTPPAKPTFTDQSYTPGPVGPMMPQPTYRERLLQMFKASPEGQLVEGAKGAVKTLVSQLPKPNEATKPFLPNAVRTPINTELTNPAQKLGGLATNAGEFLLGGEATAAANVATNAPLLAKAATQAATSYGVSKLQGSSEVGSRVNAALGALGPVVSEAMPVLGQAIRDRAVKQLALRLSKGLAEPNPAVEYGLKTGDVAPDVKDAVRIVRQAAGDILDAPVRATWGKWLTSLSKDAAEKGQDLGTALKGPLGDVTLFKQPIYDELDKLIQQSAQHLANTPSSTPGGLGGGINPVTYNPDLLNASKALKETLDQYAPMISVRNLSDLKRAWDDVVYTLSTSGKVGLGSEALLNSAKKKVAAVGANTIRQVFDQHAPTIDALNEAASNAYRLQDLVQKVFLKQPGMGVAGKVVAGTAGSVGGFLAGQTVGHPYVVMGMGAAASRALVKVFESPLFQTLTPSAKNELAYAIASGNSDAVLKITGPLLKAEVSQKTQAVSASVP